MGLSNHITERLMKQAMIERRPVKVNFELLPVCNLNCRMCYIRSDMDRVQAEGGLRPYEEWLRLAEEMREADVLFLLLTGGEVFLYPGFRDLYEQLYRMGFLLTINTNATLINEKAVSWLAQYPPKCVSISLYGADNETYRKLCGQEGMFTRVDHAVRLLRESQIAVELKTMFTPLNAADAENCIKYAAELGIPYETAAYAFPPVRKEKAGGNREEESTAGKQSPSEQAAEKQIRFTPEEAVRCTFECSRLMSDDTDYAQGIVNHLKKYEKTRKNPGHLNKGFHCAAANNSCWITWQGHMTPCAMMNEPYTLPFVHGFADSWEKLKEKTDSILLSAECSYCEKRAVCTVCPASALAETGHFDGTSLYHCRMTELTLDAMYRYMKKYHLNIGKEDNP